MKVKLFYSNLDKLCTEIIDILTEANLIDRFDLINIFQNDKIIPNLPPELKFTPAIITEDVKNLMCGHDAIVYIKMYCNTNLKTNNINTIHITKKFDEIIDNYKGTKGINMDFSKISIDFKYLIDAENEKIKNSSMVSLNKIGKEIIDMKKITNEIQNDDENDETKRITLIKKDEREGDGDINKNIKNKLSSLKNKIKIKKEKENSENTENTNEKKTKNKIKVKDNDDHKIKKIKVKDDDDNDNDTDKKKKKIKVILNDDDLDDSNENESPENNSPKKVAFKKIRKK